MEIKGREIRFLRTVQATCDLIDMCPDHDIERLPELFNGDLSKMMKNGAKFISIMNEGYEMNRAFNEEGYNPQVIQPAELLYLRQEQFQALLDSAMKAMTNGAEQEVLLEEPKKSEKGKESD